MKKAIILISLLMGGVTSMPADAQGLMGDTKEACTTVQCFMNNFTLPSFVRAFGLPPSDQQWRTALEMVSPSAEKPPISPFQGVDLQGLNPATLTKALQVKQCAQDEGDVSPSKTMAIIDFDVPSTQPRLWVVDVEKKVVLMKEWVAHGSGSGENMATAFSNTPESYQTSLGLFKAAETYHGKHGLSMRLDGLEENINDQARDRAIVMHSAAYVDPIQARKQGRLGRSQGCPAVRPEAMQPLARALSQQGLVFAYSSKGAWEEHTPYASCLKKMKS